MNQKGTKIAISLDVLSTRGHGADSYRLNSKRYWWRLTNDNVGDEPTRGQKETDLAGIYGRSDEEVVQTMGALTGVGDDGGNIWEGPTAVMPRARYELWRENEEDLFGLGTHVGSEGLSTA